MKKITLSLLLLSCHMYAAKCPIKEVLKVFFMSKENAPLTTPSHTLLTLCELAQKTDTADSFKELHTHIYAECSKEEIVKLHNTLQQILPAAAAWNIYTTMFDAERSKQQLSQQTTSAQLWQKCLQTTITELKKHNNLMTCENNLKGAIVKLVDVKVRADEAQAALKPSR